VLIVNILEMPPIWFWLLLVPCANIVVLIILAFMIPFKLAEKFGKDVPDVSKWAAVKAAAKATPLASRVAGFIVQWAIATQLDGKDEYSITEYQRFWSENERKAYRLQAEFRELWPEFETPNELAQQIVKFTGEKLAKKDVATLPMRLQVAV
jgi:hypothetical protein